MLLALVLGACGEEEYEKDNINADDSTELENESQENKVEEDEMETLFEKDTDLVLFENEDVKIDLLLVGHGRSDLTDHVALKTEIENKQNKTFEFYIHDLAVDGKEIDRSHSWTDTGEIKPNDTIEVFINGYEYEELSVEEHVSGTIILRDYEGNRDEIKFSEYINE